MPPIRSTPKRILGVDFGLKRIGLALSDERQIIADPLPTLLAEQRTEATAKKLLSLIEQLETERQCIIEEIVIGLPILMNGKQGFLADEVNFFVQQLSAITQKSIRTWDERLSTVQAERSLKEVNFTRKRRAQVVDRVSATIILQSYLDFKAHTK